MELTSHPGDDKQHETPHADGHGVENEKVPPEAAVVDTPQNRASSENPHLKQSESDVLEVQRSEKDSLTFDDGYKRPSENDFGTSVSEVANVKNVNENLASLSNWDDDNVDFEHKHYNPATESNQDLQLNEYNEYSHEADPVPTPKEQNWQEALEEEPEEEPEPPKEEEDLEERLQLYSEMLSLQKELEVVKEDEERLRQQLHDMQRLISEQDPQVAKIIAVLEDEAQQSPLSKIWKEQCQKIRPDEMDWSEINVNDMSQRVQEVRRIAMLNSEKVDLLYANRDAKINEHTDSREQSKAQLKERFEEEMEKLKELRNRLKQIIDEHRFHKHRGTARVENRNIVSDETKKSNRMSRIGEIEVRTAAKSEALKESLTDLMEDCKVLKKQLDESLRLSEQRKNELGEALKKMQDEGSETRDMRQMLEEEREELSALKADLQGVLHYVRAAKREEELF